MEHAELAALEQGLQEVRGAPGDTGTIELIACRPAENEREVLEEAELDPAVGLVGDCWRVKGSKSTPDGASNPDTQLTLMSARAAALVAGPRERWPLAGDQLYVDLDLSGANLPPGTRLEVGSAVIEITDVPHTGCGKFSRRFGVDAMKFVNSIEGRKLNLRGVNARIVSGGTVRTGDAVRRIAS
jgi:hypothetical protein